jgi:hypothetical protein
MVSDQVSAVRNETNPQQERALLEVMLRYQYWIDLAPGRDLLQAGPGNVAADLFTRFGVECGPPRSIDERRLVRCGPVSAETFRTSTLDRSRSRRWARQSTPDRPANGAVHRSPRAHSVAVAEGSSISACAPRVRTIADRGGSSPPSDTIIQRICLI